MQTSAAGQDPLCVISPTLRSRSFFPHECNSTPTAVAHHSCTLLRFTTSWFPPVLHAGRVAQVRIRSGVLCSEHVGAWETLAQDSLAWHVRSLCSSASALLCTCLIVTA